MKTFLYLTIFMIQACIVNGQRGYYVKDNIVVAGVKLNDKGAIKNAKHCQIEEKGQTFTYSPDEVEEYSLENGSIYLSRTIKIKNEGKKVFLERLNKGEINLYYYKDKNGKKFFLEKDSGQLVEILKKGNDNRTYKDLLRYYVQDCDKVNDALKLVSYNKLSLSKFAKQYNSCTKEPFPFKRYGLIFGYGVSKPVNSKFSDDLLKNAVFKNDYSFNIGLFMDIPILLSDFSAHSEIYYQKNTFSYHSVVNSNINDIIINATSINIPILIRYTYPSLKLRPYFNLGGSVVYNLRNNNAVYSTAITTDIIEIEKVNDADIYSENQIGYIIGGGIQYNIDYRKSGFFELRFNNLYGIAEQTYGRKSFQCIIGINF